MQTADVEAWRTVGDVAKASGLAGRAADAYRHAIGAAGSQSGGRLRGQVALAYSGLAALGDAASLATAKAIVAELKASGRLTASLAEELARSGSPR